MQLLNNKIDTCCSSKELEHCTASTEQHHHWYLLLSGVSKAQGTLVMPASVSLLQCILKKTMNSGQIQEVYSTAQQEEQ